MRIKGDTARLNRFERRTLGSELGRKVALEGLNVVCGARITELQRQERERIHKICAYGAQALLDTDGDIRFIRRQLECVGEIACQLLMHEAEHGFAKAP